MSKEEEKCALCFEFFMFGLISGMKYFFELFKYFVKKMH